MRSWEKTSIGNGSGLRLRPAVVLALVGLALLALGLAGCSGSPDSSTPDGANREVKRGRAPDFQIVAYQGGDLLGGQEIAFSELLAQRNPVVLNFWAGLCPPCRAEMPDLQEIHDEYQGRVLLFGLDVGPFVGLGSREDGRALLGELGVTYPAGTTFDQQVVGNYGVVGMPTTYFIKPNGEIFRKWTGLLTKGKMVELVEELLSAS